MMTPIETALWGMSIDPSLTVEYRANPPSANAAKTIRHIGGQPRIVKAKAVVDYQSDLAFVARSAANAARFTPGEHLGLAVELFLKRGRDWDNPIKLVQDALSAGLKINDSRFECAVVIKRSVAPKRQGLRVTVYNLKEAL